jgi:death-on-curing protein
MGGTGKTLTVRDIIEINRRMIEQFGGEFFGEDNLLNPGSLEHVLEEIQGSLFGYEPYPSIIEKAAVISWRIIAGHIFNDGNKRTGMETCRLLLDLNSHTMRIDSEVVDMALAIASGNVQLDGFIEWLRHRTVEK